MWELPTIGTRIRRDAGCAAPAARRATEHRARNDQPTGSDEDKLEGGDIEERWRKRARAQPESDTQHAERGNGRSDCYADTR